MVNTIRDFTDNLPSTYEQLEARFEFFKTVNREDLFSFEDTPQLKWVFWEDGAGNEGRLILLPETREAIVYGYDHESDMNFYDRDVEQTVFNQFPEHLRTLLDDDKFKWPWEEDYDMVFATVGFWFDTAGWHYSTDYVNQVDWDDEVNSAIFVLNFVNETEKYWLDDLNS